jgi:hypothetical protein
VYLSPGPGSSGEGLLQPSHGVEGLLLLSDEETEALGGWGLSQSCATLESRAPPLTR